MSKSIGHMIASSNPQRVLPKTISAKNIPDVLIHEIIDGIPLYRKGYRDVLAKTKTVEDIMGCSSLQFFIIDYLLRLLYKGIDENQYIIATNEAGIHIDKRNNLSGDMMLFDRDVLTIDKINKHYAQVHPKISIEIDLDIELETFTQEGYMNIKTKKLLDFGADKVIWFLTQSKSVMTATNDGTWKTVDWNEDVDILDGIICNVGKYLKDKGSEFA
ncbi:Uma2 family endonuclease [Dyadobacter chenhuakuii]|uniref:Uma2 family endonuclease n=1 Tax=Dyadobacter chenhuakuii TaxID=2909339 RepID=A0A9X1QFZ0_9BACT|nr:Uma2 family endonuclease [Dyadobacter chenhuakuii]MCF2499623.1 Uma2 family endonuclease [Dyadobacter chenhuakuii]